MQHTDSYKFFYLHDRLGSVRQVINAAGSVIRLYSYDPFGQLVEQMAAPPLGLTNSFLFAGQWYDSEIGQYYLRARQYDPRIGRFTARDPVFGNFQEPLTLHVYLYCLNDPVNRTDPSGEIAPVAVYIFAKAVVGAVLGGYGSYRTSGGKWDAAALGAVCGALSSMIGPGFSGIIQAAVLSGVSNSYAYYRKTGSVDLGSVGFLTGFAGGGVMGGLMGSLGINDTGLLAFLGGTLAGNLYSAYLSIPIGPLDNLEDLLKEKEQVDEEFYKRNPGWR